MEENDEAQLCRAADWRGVVNHVSSASHVASPPTDIEFKDYFELIYNHPGIQAPNVDTLYCAVYMPVLDDTI